MKQKFFLLIILLIIAGLLTFLWWNQAIKAVNPTTSENVSFSIQKGESIRNIAEKLQKKDLIRSPVAFFLLARFTNFAKEIQAGEFVLNPSMNLYNIANTLRHGTVDVSLTIPEGWRKEEVAQTLADKLNLDEKEFLKITKEGYLFPDTYRFAVNSDLETVKKTFENNFNKKVTPSIVQKAKEKNLSLNELIIIASLVEREAKFQKDRPLIASVILNRLDIGMKLDIDATVQYALGFQKNTNSWWKKNLTISDLNIDSPYNTYLNPGLPPTAISNPGLASIKSVMNAANTDYLYYVSESDGTSHFASSIEEHNQNINKYLN